ncbi:hypothetical protein [Paenibacillus campi]|uniref:hypothetical protein n=1 Tax=Paenibacillus campi TaxID=3106031 RepID=UPI002AFE571E|nr:hypothetical protein [Paenibacillus sp. SGZ-1014]
MEYNQSSNQEQEVTFNVEQQTKIDGMLEDAKKQWEDEFLNPIISERDDLMQFKPVEKSDAELQLEQREKELFQKEINFTLRESELEDFAEFFNVHNVEELQAKITKLNTILNDRKIKNSYVPENHKSQSQYEQAQSKGNVQDMISAKLSKVFGK